MAEMNPSMQHYQAHDPDFIELVDKLRTFVYAPGALDTKTKMLIAMCLDAQANHPHGVGALAKRARAAGATEDEIKEALRVTYEMAAMQVLVTQHTAFPE